MGFLRNILKSLEEQNKKFQEPVKKRATDYPSIEGKRRKAPSTPIIIYGYKSDSLAKYLSECTTVSCIAIYEIEYLSYYVKNYASIGIIAHSNTDKIGEAGVAIGVYRENQKEKAMALYSAWDYNIERAAKRAIEYKADGIMMPGIVDRDLFKYVFGILADVSKDATIPTTIEEHIQLLEKYTTKESPFWEMQDLIVSPYY